MSQRLTGAPGIPGFQAGEPVRPDSTLAALRWSTGGRLCGRHARMVQQGAVLLAGAVSALGFAPLNIWPLPILALAFLIERGYRAPRSREAFWAGWCFALGHFLASLHWIAESFNHQDSMPHWLGWLGVILLAAYLALYPGLACALAWRLSGRTPLAWVLLLAASWMLLEWARSVVLGGFAWNPLAVIWLALPPVAQMDAWIGPYALSGLVVLAGGAVWLGVQHRWRTTVGVALAVAVGATALTSAQTGRQRLADAQALGMTAVPVHVVQPNISEDQKHDTELADTNFERYFALSNDTHTAPRLLLWPEGALDRVLDAKYAHSMPHDFMSPLDLTGVLGQGDVLLTGGPSADIDDRGHVSAQHNSVFAISGDAQVLWRYDKAHLVPFGEFLPARPILSRLGLSRLVPGHDEDFSSGPGPRTLEIPGFRVSGKPLMVAVDICYEIIFPGRVVDKTHRPLFVFNPSNDAWFASWGPPQHLAQAQLRAIEEGLPVIRATPDGISAVISPHGMILQQRARGQAGAIDMPLPAALPATLFSRLGAWTSGVVGVVLGAAGLALSAARGRRQGQS